MTDSYSTPVPEQLTSSPIVNKPVDLTGFTQQIKNLYQLTNSKPSFEICQVTAISISAGTITIQKIGTTTVIPGVPFVGHSGSCIPDVGEYVWCVTNFPGALPFALGVPAPKVAIAKYWMNANFNAVNNAFTKLNIDANWIADINHYFTHDNVTNNTRVTTQRSGFYLVDGAINYNANANGSRACQLYVNGNAVKVTIWNTSNAIFGDTVSCSMTLRLTAGDYIEMAYYQNSGGLLQVNAGFATTYLTIVRLADRD